MANENTHATQLLLQSKPYDIFNFWALRRSDYAHFFFFISSSVSMAFFPIKVVSFIPYS